MAVFKGSGIFSKVIFVVFRFSVLLFAANQCGTEAILMWTAPPPAWNQTNAGTTLAVIQTAVYQVRNGSTNVLLRWNYTLLPSQALALTTFSIGDGNSQDDIGFVISPGPSATPSDKYKDLFSIYSTRQFSNLTINKVTEQENATFQCKLAVGGGFWAYNIRIEVTDPADITHISENHTANENEEVTLNCSAKGLPTPSITWTRVSDNSSVSFPLTITGKQDEGGYRCTAENGIGNPASQVVYIIVENYHPIDTNLMTSIVDNSVVVNESFNITCSAQANPSAKYRFYKDQDNFVNDTAGSGVSVIITSVSERNKQVNYSCTPFNDFGDGPTDGLSLTVLYAPDRTILTTVPSNRTLPRHSILTLNCTTDASPEAEYHFYFNGTSIGNSSSGVFNTSVMADGVYTCVPINTVGTGDNATVNVTAVVAPSVEISNETAIVVEGESLELKCNASGEPDPSVTWTKVGSPEVLSNTSSLTIVNVSRPEPPDNRIKYKCTASNGVGTPATATSTIDVHYAASVTGPANVSLTVESGTEVNFLCLAMGNPAPTVKWTSPDDDIHWLSNLTNVTFIAESGSSGLYLCTVKNVLGEAIKRFKLVVTGNSFLMTLTVTNKGCDDNPSVICEQMGEKVKKEIAGQLESVTVKNCKCGSVTAYLSLDFTQRVKIPEVLSVLKKAAEGSGFGEFQVDPGSIQAISDDQLPTVSSTSTVRNPTPDGNKGKVLWIIIGASVGGVIVLVVVVVVAWCVHHKRKCRRKGSKVRCSESEAFAPGKDNGSGHVNNGYADAGPLPTAMEDMSQHQGASAVPTYATVDKYAKKGSKKDKVEEQKRQTEAPQYAAVDKSKKKKKEEPEATYAQVDKSKKSKKKPKLGEVLYADLGDFQQMQELPRVSTSPQALPPIKKPTTYVETQYADITQFLKGDVTLPDSNNSQGPATGSKAAPAPENSSSQEPGTSTKETSQASNPGGDGGPGHETNF